MDIRELEYFITIAQEKNLTRASEKLYVGQPTLTKYLQKLEKEWELPMFSRTGKELTLTYAGERFLRYAQQMIALSRSMENEMLEIRRADTGVLIVGMPPVRCSIVLPAVLPRFHKAFPGVDFRIVEDSSEKLDQALLEGKIDLAFYSISREKKELDYQILREDTLYAVLRRDHPVGKKAFRDGNGKPAIRLDWLQDEVFLLQTRQQRQGEYVRRMLEEHRMSDIRIQEHSNIRAAVFLAAEGYGVAFLSGSFLNSFRREMDFDCYVLPEAETKIRFAAAWRTGHYLPVYAKEFIELVRRTHLDISI